MRPLEWGRIRSLTEYAEGTSPRRFWAGFCKDWDDRVLRMVDHSMQVLKLAAVSHLLVNEPCVYQAAHLYPCGHRSRGKASSFFLSVMTSKIARPGIIIVTAIFFYGRFMK